MNESPESLLQSLRNPRALPVEAIKAAKSDRARVAPLLIQELRKFAADFQSYDRNDCLPIIAIYLLAEWELTESFEPVLDCFALDDKYGGYELGDLITENGPQCQCQGLKNSGVTGVQELQEEELEAGISASVRYRSR